jgi:hypothetical protein
MTVVEYYYDESDNDKVQDQASKVLDRIRDRLKALGRDADEDEDTKNEDEEEEE